MKRNILQFTKVLAVFAAVGWLACGCCCLPASAAEISGRVTLKGTPPPEIKIVFDATCGKLHTTNVYTRHYAVGKDDGLADVFVHVKAGLEGKTFPPPKDVPLIDQVKCIFVPKVIGVRTNQLFRVKNSDPLMHNVHAVPKVEGNEEFNIGQPLQGMIKEATFAKPEVLVKIICDVHPWMFAYVGVVEHPFFAVTDNDGNFKFPPGLPAGIYTIEAYHLKAGRVTQQVTVAEDEKKTVNFVLQVPAPKK